MTTTTTFTLPDILVPNAQAVLCEWTYVKIGPYADSEDFTLREVDETLTTISALHWIGAPGEPLHARYRAMEAETVALLREVTLDISELAGDIITENDRARASAKYWEDLKAKADALLEVLR